MKILLNGGLIPTENGFKKVDIAIENDTIIDISSKINSSFFDLILDVNNNHIFTGFTDVHVHFREPGFFYKETIETGSKAAARGGYTTVCTMPNLNPAPDCLDNLKIQQDIIDKTAVIEVLPYASITKGQKGEGELVDFVALKDKCFAFSDDGRGVQAKELMLDAMNQVQKLNKTIVAHCEDDTMLHGGYIHDGEYAKLHNHKGICSASEYSQIARDIELSRKSGCKYHICHISTKESVELIRKAKADGLNVTCETAPHYLVFTDMDLIEDGKFKMNPPIRSKEDKQALIEGIKDGTIDVIATDHAPHSLEEKSKGLSGSAMGIVGIETAFSVLYTYLVKENIITMDRLIDLLAINARKIFNLEENKIEVGSKANLVVIDLEKEYTINPDDFLSKGRATPFEGHKVFGEVKYTIYKGNLAWNYAE